MFSENRQQIYRRFTGEHPCWCVISIKLLYKFIEITLWHGCSHVNLLHFSEHLFLRTPLKGCVCLEPWDSDQKNFYIKVQSNQFIIYLYFCTIFPSSYHLHMFFHYFVFLSFLCLSFLPWSKILLIWDLNLNFLWIQKP